MEMWFSEFHTPDVKLSIRMNKQLYSVESDYQRIDIFETPEFGRVLTLDGNVMLTERDEFIYDEMITHIPMAVHKEAKTILVIGAGDGGVVRELTRYDRVERIAKDLITKGRNVHKPVCANVDLYSGFVYSVLKIPVELFTPIFAIARIAGWSAHRIEEISNNGKIIRPAYKYVGHHKDYVPIDER